MSLAASAKPLARERSSSENFLKALPQAESGTKAAPISGDYSFLEPKTTSKSLQMRILDPVHHPGWDAVVALHRDRKSTRLNSSHVEISYAVFCLKKKKKN